MHTSAELYDMQKETSARRTVFFFHTLTVSGVQPGTSEKCVCFLYFAQYRSGILPGNIVYYSYIII